MRLWMKAIGGHMGRHALFYAIMFGFGASALCRGVYDNFITVDKKAWTELGWWQLVAMVAKSSDAAIAAMVAYAIKPTNANNGGSPNGDTTPPFHPTPPAPKSE